MPVVMHITALLILLVIYQFGQLISIKVNDSVVKLGERGQRPRAPGCFGSRVMCVYVYLSVCLCVRLRGH